MGAKSAARASGDASLGKMARISAGIAGGGGNGARACWAMAATQALNTSRDRTLLIMMASEG